MTFSEYAKMLYPYCGNSQSQSNFVVALIGSFMEDTDDPNPLLDMAPDYLGRIYSRKRKISQQNATAVLGHLDTEAFGEYMGAFSLEAIESIANELSKRGIANDGSVSDVVSKCTELFIGIMRDIAGAGAAAADTEFAEEISPDLSKLRTLFAKLPHPVILSPPDELSEDEMPYVEALLEAYADAEGLEKLSKDELDSYRKYKKNFQRQRKDYYAAESVRRGTREAFGNTDPDQFETLKNETYDGIVDVHEQEYENGFDRLGAVMTQAAITPISKCTLCETDWIGNSEKKGVCHFLVNDGRIKWVDGDE